MAEVNRYQDILQGETTEEMAEGSMVILGAPEFTSDDGVYGVSLPADSTDGTNALYCVLLPPTNIKAPYYQPNPSFSYGLRGFFDQDTNDPFSADVNVTYPGDRTQSTIPSGVLVRVFGPGSVITVFSGNFVADSLAKGEYLVAEYSGDDAGKLKYSATATRIQVEEYDSDNLELTFRIF